MQIGYYKLVLPAKYMNEDASEKDKEVADLYKKYFQELMDGTRKGMVFPALTDQDGNYLFDLQYVGPSNVTIINNTQAQQPSLKHRLAFEDLTEEEFEEKRGRQFNTVGKGTVGITSKFPTWESNGNPLHSNVVFETYQQYKDYVSSSR